MTQVILDTDIGTDIDDTWALAMLLRSPELDLRLVTAATADTVYRARLVAKLLELGGRPDVPIGVGPRQDKRGGPQAEWLGGYELSDYPGPVLEDGVGALIEGIMSADPPVALVCIGPASNVAEALEREPAIAGRARFVGMHGSLRRGYLGSAEVAAEYNVAQDAAAFRRVVEAPWPVTITPLDSCGVVALRGENYRAVLACEDPLVQAVIESYRLWIPHVSWARQLDPDRGSSPLYDTVAVYLAFAEELLEIEELGIRVTGDGYTRVDPAAPSVRCATEWRDRAAFEAMLAARLTGRMAP